MRKKKEDTTVDEQLLQKEERQNRKILFDYVSFLFVMSVMGIFLENCSNFVKTQNYCKLRGFYF